MKAKLLVTFGALLIGSQGFAAVETQTLTGIGLNGKACSVEILRDGNNLVSVKLNGAASVFEILAEKQSGYGPVRKIRDMAASEILQIAEDNKELYQHFTHRNHLLSAGETFKLDTNNIPKAGEGLKGIKMIMKLQLKYQNGELSSVTAENKAKALWIATLASARFVCN